LDTQQLVAKLDDIVWEEVMGKRGQVTRSSAWYVAKPCSCTYQYGGDSWPANLFPPWMDELCQQIQQVFKYDAAPNAINFNEYKSGSNSLYWHADDEELFIDKQGNTTVLSLSVGATRLFQLLRNGSSENDTMDIELEDGMFLEMAGKTQLHYKHQVPPNKMRGLVGKTRYNLTFRWIHTHAASCEVDDDL
jgi:alkylated DNA repair dioxygenase AlkB